LMVPAPPLSSSRQPFQPQNLVFAHQQSSIFDIIANIRSLAILQNASSHRSRA